MAVTEQQTRRSTLIEAAAKAVHDTYCQSPLCYVRTPSEFDRAQGSVMVDAVLLLLAADIEALKTSWDDTYPDQGYSFVIGYIADLVRSYLDGDDDSN